MAPINFLSGKSYYNSTLILSLLSFYPNWKLYLLLKQYYGNIWGLKFFLFIPSVTFWGSGILKETFTLCFIITSIYCAFSWIELKKYKLRYVLAFLICLYGIINIKPYLFIGLAPSITIWFFWSKIRSIKIKWLRRLITPLILFFALLLVVVTWNISSQFLGVYSSIDSILEKAHISYIDLKQDYYGGNSFSIGDYDPTISGVISKFPIALFSGLYRPLITEVKNVFMLFSALENLFLLGFSLFLLIYYRLSVIRVALNDPFVIFCALFSIILAFAITISTSNFGSLVRFKIPYLPFFYLFLIICRYRAHQKPL